MFKAEIIADSKNTFGNRITTFIVTFPRIILAEFNTHRMLSRNSASSRAIPFEKMLKSVEDNPFIPIKWMKDHRGMQGNDFFTDSDLLHFKCDNPDTCPPPIPYPLLLESDWLEAKDHAIKYAVKLNQLGLTKQFINRLLEPFMWHTVIVTATEWENFFALRAHDAAEIHMQRIAYMMLDEYNKSEPQLLQPGEWHIPFENEIENELIKISTKEDVDDRTHERIKIKTSTSMCARTSYTIVGDEKKEINFEKDTQLHDKLLSMRHMSPFEHCAMSAEGLYPKLSGNFQGFIQYRKQIENENRNDERVIKK